MAQTRFSALIPVLKHVYEWTEYSVRVSQQQSDKSGPIVSGSFPRPAHKCLEECVEHGMHTVRITREAEWYEWRRR
jgi:hypothetical protein